MTAPRRRSGGLARFATALVATALTLALGELVLRLAGIRPERFAPLRAVENADKSAGIDAYPTNPRGYFDLDLRDVALRARLAARGLVGLDEVARQTPYAVEFSYNPDRCRDRARTDRVPGVRRVIVIGDSFAEGEGVREVDTFSRRIERALRDAGLAVEVFNCGRRGRDFPALYDERFALARRYDADVVLYAMVLNDPVQSAAFRARQGYLNDWILDRRRARREEEQGFSMRVLDLVRERWEAARIGRETTRWYQEMYGPANADGWARTQEFLARMDAETRARGATFLVALLPLLVGLEGKDPFAAVRAEIARAAHTAGWQLHDVAPALRGRSSATLWVHPVDMHPNEIAHALIAADLVPWLRATLSARAGTSEPPGRHR